MNTHTLLLVEDDMFVSDIYLTKLRKEGFQVESAIDGRDALKKMKTLVPDMVLLDLMMPYVDGMEVLEFMKQDKKLASVPVIVLTNLSEKENINRAMQLGADDYIIKSHFTPSEVLEKIQSLLNKKTMV